MLGIVRTAVGVPIAAVLGSSVAMVIAGQIAGWNRGSIKASIKALCQRVVSGAIRHRLAGIAMTTVTVGRLQGRYGPGCASGGSLKVGSVRPQSPGRRLRMLLAMALIVAGHHHIGVAKPVHGVAIRHRRVVRGMTMISVGLHRPIMPAEMGVTAQGARWTRRRHRHLDHGAAEMTMITVGHQYRILPAELSITAQGSR